MLFSSLYLYSQAAVPLAQGLFDIRVFRHLDPGGKGELESIVISQGPLKSTSATPTFVRVHSECFTGEVLNSLKCDCKFQLDSALETIREEKNGLVIYLRQEGRGIGLGNKIKAYHLQNAGLDTIEANQALGYPNDLRDFSLAAAILADLEVLHIRLHTNNPEKIKTLRDNGITITNVVPSLPPVHNHNFSYLHTKYQKLGHHLSGLFSGDHLPANFE